MSAQPADTVRGLDTVRAYIVLSRMYIAHVAAIVPVYANLFAIRPAGVAPARSFARVVVSH